MQVKETNKQTKMPNLSGFFQPIWGADMLKSSVWNHVNLILSKSGSLFLKAWVWSISAKADGTRFSGSRQLQHAFLLPHQNISSFFPTTKHPKVAKIGILPCSSVKMGFTQQL